jgi:hypothetical protein
LSPSMTGDRYGQLKSYHTTAEEFFNLFKDT